MRGLRFVAFLLATVSAACAASAEEPQRLPLARAFCMEFGWSRLGMAKVEDSVPGPTSAKRVYSKARFVWIRKRPTAESEWIGYITLGQSLALRANVEPPATFALTTSEGTLGIAHQATEAGYRLHSLGIPGDSAKGLLPLLGEADHLLVQGGICC